LSANRTQVGGTHYASKAIQPQDAMEAWMTRAEFAGFLRGNAIKGESATSINNPGGNGGRGRA